METVTVKFQEDVLERIDTTIAGHNFNSRTEFIREAVRDKLADLSREDLINAFLQFRGKAKVKTSDKHRRKIRDEVGKELIERLEKKFK